jgi:uncharacterized repeat protein (TIGR03803 family)
MRKIWVTVFILSLQFTTFSCYSQITILNNFGLNPDGYSPYGCLISDSVYLYGITSTGGINSSGTIFKIMPDGSNYIKLLDFGGAAYGATSLGSLVSDGTFLYGMTEYGGTNNKGVIFKIKKDGSGFVKLLNFAGATNGSFPYGTLIYDGTFLYGMTRQGGVNDFGIVFKIKTDGSSFANLHEFGNGQDGALPTGSFIFDGTFLYGMTEHGGASGAGTIFKIKPDGTGYIKLFDFADIPDGARPYGSLIYDGAFLYGTTGSGGIDNGGTIFKIKTDGSGYVKTYDFTGVNPSKPYGSPILYGGLLFGMTWSAGVNDYGTIYKVMTDGTGYVKLLDFTGGANGSHPYGSLFSNGNFLYGMTAYGGTNGLGVIFKYALTTEIEESYSSSPFSPYPNPFTDKLTIQGVTRTTLFDYTGKEILRVKSNAEETVLNTESIAAGFYLLRVESGGEVRSFKVVKY